MPRFQKAIPRSRVIERLADQQINVVLHRLDEFDPQVAPELLPIEILGQQVFVGKLDARHLGQGHQLITVMIRQDRAVEVASKRACFEEARQGLPSIFTGVKRCRHAAHDKDPACTNTATVEDRKPGSNIATPRITKDAIPSG